MKNHKKLIIFITIMIVILIIVVLINLIAYKQECINEEEFDQIKIGDSYAYISGAMTSNVTFHLLSDNFYDKVISEVEDSHENGVYKKVYKIKGSSGGYVLITMELNNLTYEVTKKESFLK